MLQTSNVVRILGTAVVSATLFMSGCGSKSLLQEAKQVRIDALTLYSDITSSTQQTASSTLGGWEWSGVNGFASSFGPLLTNAAYNVEMRKVTYQSTGADGQLHSMTGLLMLPASILPASLGGTTPAVPILMYQHGTEMYRPYSPSQYLLHRDRAADYPEVMVATAIAATGYAVAMADYQGMGDNTDPQPYVHGASLAKQVIDMLRASRDIIGTGTTPCSWNNQLFLMGYSAGGYVTMATTRELQLNHAAEFTVTASAPLSGPHDLSGVMRGVMLSDTASKAPYFLPFILTSYQYAYGGTTPFFSADFAMKPSFNTTIPPLFAGVSQANTISEAMGMIFNPVNLIVPKSILAQQFIDQLISDTSTVVTLLRENDSYRNWAPTMPMRMSHHRSDELVPYGNSQVAFNSFSTAGAKNHTPGGPGVELIEETVSLNISPVDPVKTVHYGAAFPELSNGWQWLNSFKK
ncbi:lipase family protein [Pelotalea chapellei]|uniref:Secretory lipase n=1 Tax=Pelotalea chapellei TaxID=44671 RepID=A0ABS5U9R9_9BACT|nr:lipase family protein [Pelotalea chapellei]MBT1072405.1 hypothetical protein [Pelotalea chapellei]